MSNAKEEHRGGLKGVAVQDDDVASAWRSADDFAASHGKRVIQDSMPQVYRRESQVFWFFPYDPAERVPN